ncbi:MAG: GNAT family N-acetyltransferase [Oscillospiraceae bacterium]|jgi:ribosomal protein S18 acetylase RimI-like enzyme|nr:GNAT family N-acetyltransferase [Oscillospiraceae bacterium]
MATYRSITGREDAQQAMALFNGAADAGELLYRPFQSLDAFEAFFLHRKEEGLTTVSLLREDGAAFASGCYAAGAPKMYITLVLVKPELRRRGIGREALRALEDRLAEIAGPEVKSYEITFFNPMNFTWVIPGTNGHDHPNAPGVDVAGLGYIFLKNCGYRDFAYQNSYHVDLADYQFPADIQTRIQRLKEQGIEITYYDPAKHTGLPELFDNLGSEDWRKQIMENLALPGGGNPVLIVAQNGKAMGFTGPLSVQESGRGYFCGIGVHSDCRGNGAGKVLFSSLCKSLKDMGAGFMTLFTGETNPARNIYEAAGFSIVRSWTDMRREIR